MHYYDGLSLEEQTVERARWQHGIDEDIRTLDLAAEFTAAGRPWAEADQDGNLIVVYP